MKNRLCGMGFLFFILLTSCQPAKETIKGDIFFQREYFENRQSIMYYIDQNGKELGLIDFSSTRPAWISGELNGTLLYFSTSFPPVYGDNQIYYGMSEISLNTDNQKTKRCSNSILKSIYGPVFPISSAEGRLLLLSHHKIIEYDMLKCKIIKQIFPLANEKDVFVYGFSSSSDGKIISVAIDRRDRKIVDSEIIDLSNNSILYSGLDFVYLPSVSPDGDRVALIKNEVTKSAIYIMNVDGSNPTKILQLNPPWGVYSPMAIVPEIRWSPCGDYLLYSKCTDKQGAHCQLFENYSIYKLEISTGIETKLVDNGYYPFWMKQDCVVIDNEQ